LRMTLTLTMAATAAAGCGDNGAPTEPATGEASIVPSYRVEGMILDAAPAIACDTRVTVGAVVSDCLDVPIDGDPSHRLKTCPTSLPDAPATTETSLDDGNRPIHAVETYRSGRTVETTTEYDGFGVHKATRIDSSDRWPDVFQVAQRSVTGDPTVTTQDLDFPIFDAQTHLDGTMAYDDHDRLVEQVARFADGTLMFELGVSYDDVSRRRNITVHAGAYGGPNGATEGTLHHYQLVDASGHTIEIGNNVGSDGTASETTQWTYDDEDRVTRKIFVANGQIVTTDYFYDCE